MVQDGPGMSERGVDCVGLGRALGRQTMTHECYKNKRLNKSIHMRLVVCVICEDVGGGGVAG